MMVMVGEIRVAIKGRKRLEVGNHLIISNHPTLIDVVILGAILSRTDCIIKKALWYNPMLMGVVLAAGYITNKDAQDFIDTCVESVNFGNNLLIFPEGTRTTPGQAIKITRGAANIAIRANKEITPVVISSSVPFLTKTQKWYQVPPEGPAEITVDIGETIQIAPFLDKNNRTSVSSRNLSQYLELYFHRGLISDD